MEPGGISGFFQKTKTLVCFDFGFEKYVYKVKICI